MQCSGLSPADHVTVARYSKLLVEIDRVEGREPAEVLLEDVRGRLDDLRSGGHLGKPDGIELRFDETLAPGDDPEAVRSFSELDALARAHHRIALGLLLVVAFPGGLVPIVIGIAVVRARHLVERVAGGATWSPGRPGLDAEVEQE